MSTSIKCPICSQAIEVLPAKSAKFGKYFIQLKCPVDARHFRGFIHDRQFVESALSHHGAIHGLPGEQAS